MLDLAWSFSFSNSTCACICQQSIRVAEKITQKVEGQLSKSQKEFLLRQQVSFLAPLFMINLSYTIYKCKVYVLY